jgi:DNA-binding transcriptional regulator YhcF (GntR family)
MTEKLSANYNSVKAAFAKLAEEGFLERPSRGNYAPNMAAILLNLMDRITALEGKVKA